MSGYTEENWQEEIDFDAANPPAAFWTGDRYYAFGGRIPCPKCRTVGFYSPRREPETGEPKRKYRVCKFCGFAEELTGYAYEDSGKRPYRWIMVHCGPCSPLVRFGMYNWKVPWGAPVECGNCKNTMQEVKWPNEDPNHPFHEWKRQIEAGPKP